jgi:hypothetical protein
MWEKLKIRKGKTAVANLKAAAQINYEFLSN